MLAKNRLKFKNNIHLISKLSSIHFVSTRERRQFLRQNSQRCDEFHVLSDDIDDAG